MDIKRFQLIAWIVVELIYFTLAVVVKDSGYLWFCTFIYTPICGIITFIAVRGHYENGK